VSQRHHPADTHRHLHHAPDGPTRAHPRGHRVPFLLRRLRSRPRQAGVQLASAGRAARLVARPLQPLQRPPHRLGQRLPPPRPGSPSGLRPARDWTPYADQRLVHPHPCRGP
jgi:hypothetical protein